MVVVDDASLTLNVEQNNQIISPPCLLHVRKAVPAILILTGKINYLIENQSTFPIDSEAHEMKNCLEESKQWRSKQTLSRHVTNLLMIAVMI